MFTKYMMTILMCLCNISIAAYTSSSSISTCMTYESDASKKWCRYSTSSSSGYACDASDSSYYCGGSSSYRCSSESIAYLPQNSKKLLCPTDYSNCNTQSSYLYSTSTSQKFGSNYFGTDTFCWYKFTPSASYVYKVNIRINSLINATAEIYYESTTNSYTHKGSILSGDSMDVNVSYYEPVWVLVVPSGNNAYVSLTATQSSSYSSTTYSDNGVYLVAIIVPTIIGGSLFIICMICIIICCMNSKKRNGQNQNESAVDAENQFERASRPQIYYPPQQNYRIGIANQGVIATGTPQPACPAEIEKKQNIYMIEPVPSKSSKLAGFDPADPVLETSIHVGEGEPI